MDNKKTEYIENPDLFKNAGNPKGELGNAGLDGYKP